MESIDHGIMCHCFLCNQSRYIEGVHCTSCLCYIIQIEETNQCFGCYYKYIGEATNPDRENKGEIDSTFNV